MLMQRVRKIRGTRIARSGQGRAEDPVRAWGLVVGHRARTGTDRKASPTLPVEKQ